jgi:hypothetical protein
MTEEQNKDKLDEIVSRFTEADLALRELLIAAERLTSARDSLNETASGVFRLATELKEISRNMGDAAVSLRALNPEKIDSRLSGIAQAISNGNDKLSLGFQAITGDISDGKKYLVELRQFARRIQISVLIVLAMTFAGFIVGLVR